MSNEVRKREVRAGLAILPTRETRALPGGKTERRRELARLKGELAETRARMADAFFAMSVPFGGA